MYRMCCWYIIAGNVILCYFFSSSFSVAPFAPLLKYTCYMCNRQGAHKSHRISSSLCSHDNALLYLYWYLHFMLIWPWCILSYVWWEAIKPFWIFESWNGGTQIAKFMRPTWGPPGSIRPQMGPMLATWTLLSWNVIIHSCQRRFR